MFDSPETLNLPAGHAVAAIDGSVSKRGASAGIVLVHDGMVHLRGYPLEGIVTSWNAEASAVLLAIEAARELGVTNLRLLIDHHALALTVQGYPTLFPGSAMDTFSKLMDEVRSSGLKVSARMVQGHAETLDLPSRMNDLAHILCDLAFDAPYFHEVPATPGWPEALADDNSAFRPSWKPQRWASYLERRRTAHFLGMDVETVDDLIKSGHLDVDQRGVSRVSAAKVYVVAQRMRHDAYFGFSDPEHQPDQWENEVHRGWDHRPSGYSRKRNAARSPEPTPAPVIEEAEEECAAFSM